jgi:predicted enzyme related to lactoylglutathione lyase
MGGKVVHFEIPYDDAERARAFYSSVFGWEPMPLPDMEYTLVTTGPTGEQGATEAGFINGGMRKRSEGFGAPNIVIDVADLEQSLEAATAAGGTEVMGRQAVGEMGFTAYVLDTEGNLVGLWETAPPE